MKIARLLALLPCLCCGSSPQIDISGELEAWAPLTLTFLGPAASEQGDPNPFLDYRLDVKFTHSETRESVQVAGFFAADGNSEETGATSGNVWIAYFVPRQSGTWEYRAEFRSGPRVALHQVDAIEGALLTEYEQTGFVTVKDSDPLIRPGKIEYAGHRYFRYGNSGDWFLKAGADSPENFLAYADFDSDILEERLPGEAREGEAAVTPRHRYEPHVTDWTVGDPTWRQGKGKGIIGALNYLSSMGVNSVYFLTMNITGDGDDVWPYRTRKDRYRFDCSRLAQWNLVFDHMDKLGIGLHLVLTETENESLFEVEEGGSFADSRKLYYRELVSRFTHHNAVVWNLGEENGWNDEGWDTDSPQKRANTDQQRRAFADFLRKLDPYSNPIVVHTLPGRYEEIYEPLLGFPAIEGPSLQMGDIQRVHSETLIWIQRSEISGRPWVVNLDEIGPADTGVKPDADDPNHFEVRHLGLWGNLMAGGGGCEWYFGYEFAHNDLGLEDFRSRENMWLQTRVAVDFFRKHLPFWTMESADELVKPAGAYCLARPGDVYAVYAAESEGIKLWLPNTEFEISWYNPRSGGDLVDGSIQTVQGNGFTDLGIPPSEPDLDWVVLVRGTGQAPDHVSGPLE